MSAIQAIVPYWGTDPTRTKNLDWVEQGLTKAGIKVTVARPLDGEISKGKILWPAIRDSDAEILVLHDADVWCDFDIWCGGLWRAIATVAGGIAWAKPHHYVFRLSEVTSEEFMAGRRWEGIPAGKQLVEPPYEGVTGGGVVVARREIFLDVPVDPRFTGWGQEDQAHGEALWTLHGTPWQGHAPLLHLWHPPAPRRSRGWGSRESRGLYRRYHSAYNNSSEMRKLVSEAHNALGSPESAGNGCQSLV